MIEVNHNSEPEPEAAKPILASHLLDIEEKQRKRFAEFGEYICTGCAEIDGYVLRGGLERGIVVGISGEGKEGRLVSWTCYFIEFECLGMRNVTYFTAALLCFILSIIDTPANQLTL